MCTRERPRHADGARATEDEKLRKAQEKVRLVHDSEF
jgi:hypothetical protein